MDKMIRIIKSDLTTLEKLETVPNFKIILIQAKQTAQSLGVIDNETAYYQYQIQLSQLDKVSFLELTALERFENENYYRELIDLYQKIYGNRPMKEHKPNKIIRFDTIKNRH